MTTTAHDLYLLVAVLGLAVSASYGGQPLLCQGAFVAVGAFGVVRLERAGLPLFGAVLVAVAMAAVLGGAVAALTLRLHGASLALSTWAMAWLAYAVLLGFPSVGGGPDGLTRPVPVRLHSDVLGVSLTLTPGVHVGIAAVLCLALVAALARWDRGPAGLQLAALRASPALATSLGVPVARRRATALAVTAVLGALAGAGSTMLLGVAAPGDMSPLLSLQLFVALLVAGSAPRAWAPVAGWVVVAAIPRVADRIASAAGLPAPQLSGVITAAVLVAVVALRAPLGRVAISRRHHDESDDAPPEPRAGTDTLVVRGLSVRLDGTGIVEDVDLDVRQGDVHALIGANGSGKSTVLRALAGALRPAAGRIEWRGDDVTAAGQLAMVRAGVTRTFQRTVELAGLTPYRQALIGARSPAGADRALRLTELRDRADDDPRTLSAGQQRLLQVARAAATGAVVLLLDEPAAGMSADERGTLRRVLRRLAGDGVGVLLVEHDLALVADVADRVTVLDGGRVLAHGSPQQVATDPTVRAVYAGDLSLPEIAT